MVPCALLQDLCGIIMCMNNTCAYVGGGAGFAASAAGEGERGTQRSGRGQHGAAEAASGDRATGRRQRGMAEVASGETPTADAKAATRDLCGIIMCMNKTCA